MKKTVCLVAVMSVFAASSAMANMYGTKASKMDRNNDGAVSQSERDAYEQKKLNMADANKDGTVTGNEWSTFKASQRDQFWMADERHDKNRSREKYKDIAFDGTYGEKRLSNWDKYAPAAGGEREYNRDYNRNYDRSYNNNYDVNVDPKRNPNR